MKTSSLKVPESMQALYEEITSISDTFCKEYLNDEYAGMARKMAATLLPTKLTSNQITTLAMV